MKARLITLLLALALAAFTAAGCGDDDDDGGSAQETAPAETTTAEPPTDTTGEDTGGAGEATELQIAADPGGALAFDKEELQAPAGEITIVMDNPSTLPHAVEIEGAGDDAVGETVNQGGKSEATATLDAGEYVYFCPVPGHQEGGMEGTLTVQ